MQVRIQQSIDAEEIPAEISNMLLSCGSLVSDIDELLGTAAVASANGHLISLFDKLDQIRESLKKVDDRLEDCQGLLAGYTQLVANIIVPTQEEPSPAMTNSLSESDKISELRSLLEKFEKTTNDATKHYEEHSIGGHGTSSREDNSGSA